MARGRLSATNLAAYYHLNCDLYLHNVYHRPTGQGSPLPSNIAQAHFNRGLDWEAALFAWLDAQHLLLTLPAESSPIAPLVDLIRNDQRDHFFVSGLALQPPQEFFDDVFRQHGVGRVVFSIAKPDLLEIFRPTNDAIIWRVIDAKSSDNVKASHYAQIYFYTLCLSYLLPQPQFRPSGSTAIWLSSASSRPSFADLKPVALSLLAPSLHSFLFGRLPRILERPKNEVEWHYNPLCRNCPYESECRGTSLMEGSLGTIPNMSHADALTVKNVLNLSCGPRKANGLSDIEELHSLFSEGNRWKTFEDVYPSTFKKARKILGVVKRRTKQGVIAISPALDAAMVGEIQITQKRSYTCPQSEDIAIVLSLVRDPSVVTPSFAYFCLSVFSNTTAFIPRKPVSGVTSQLVSALAAVIRRILEITPVPTTQFYVFSSGEHTALQSHLVDSALNLTDSDEDIRLCIGALASGASLLRTTYQPLILSGALLSLLSDQQTLAHRINLEVCAERLGMSIEPSEDLDATVRDRLRELQRELEAPSSTAEDESRRSLLGQIPRVVSVKSEVERLLALPIPGYWDLEECTKILVTESSVPEYPGDDDILAIYKSRGFAELQDRLKLRNWYIHAILNTLRTRVTDETPGRPNLLVNPGRKLAANCMDICQEEHLRKLFFMQQFEVLSRLTELWKARIEGCPDAPIIEYESTIPGERGLERRFKVVSGAIDMLIDKEKNFYDYLIVADEDDNGDIPVEALFDDLSVASLVFPLINSTKARWENQHPIVQDKLALVDLLGISSGRGKQTTLTLQLWGGGTFQLVAGQRYRLSPRLVDFNTSKVLTTLFELDVRGSIEDPSLLPFWQLIKDPHALRHIGAGSNDVVQSAAALQRMFRELYRLGSDSANALMLQASQQQAAKRVLTSRLSVVWGPPGTGKTHTIALAILRLLDAETRVGVNKTRIIYISAMTHVAIQACLDKLTYLISCYRQISHLESDWLDDVKLERVFSGNSHQPPLLAKDTVRYVYAGTVYQLYNFSKRNSIEVDAVVLDEAGQLGLSPAALVLRALKPEGRMIFAGDSEQLAPILAGSYPAATKRLFGSVLDYLMSPTSTVTHDEPGSQGSMDGSSQGSIVQLTENFRLNPDLGDFISTIYRRSFKPQKTQEKELALHLQSLQTQEVQDSGINPSIAGQVRAFFLALSDVMLRKPQRLLHPPSLAHHDEVTLPSVLSASGVFGIPSTMNQPHLPVSLSMIQLETDIARPDYVGYEVHVRAEAAVAAALVASIQSCLPDSDIFVATPYRNQRQAVKAALEKTSRVKIKTRARSKGKNGRSPDDILAEGTSRLTLDDDRKLSDRVTVDTVERLQGSEADFVVCLFSLPPASGVDMSFMLERRRLNVAISRAKTLCILITSPEVLRPTVRVLADEGSAKGYAFLRAFEERAWSTSISVDLDSFEAAERT